ncbi:MAG: nucleotidyltransferase domain-containing protein [Nanoarchaeota archaeon]|nr:nucleotidyltransferase domain-containing protein [Nanoarchaeota archaeon]
MLIITQLSKMLHNKIYEILKFFLGNYNREIYGRELINKVDISQKNIALTLKELEKKNILKSNKKGNLKFYSLNIKNPQLKIYLITSELFKKEKFLTNNKKIAHIFKDDDRIVGIFGSYAKSRQRKDSDVDIFIIGNKGEDYIKQGKLYDLDISIKTFTEEEFKKLLKEKNNLIREIIENHILVFNVEKFINFIWRDFYGFN